jgi:hypothetical protein
MLEAAASVALCAGAVGAASAAAFFLALGARRSRAPALPVLPMERRADVAPGAFSLWRMYGCPVTPSAPQLGTLLAAVQDGAARCHAELEPELVLRRLLRIHPSEVHALWALGGAATLVVRMEQALRETGDPIG